MPVGLPDVSHYPELFVALLDSGSWSLEDLSKLAGLNFLRVMKDVEKVQLHCILEILTQGLEDLCKAKAVREKKIFSLNPPAKLRYLILILM